MSQFSENVRAHGRTEGRMDGWTDRRTDGPYFIGLFLPRPGVQKTVDNRYLWRIRNQHAKVKQPKHKRCDALRDLGSVNIWRLHGRSNECECMLTLFSTFISFLSVCMSNRMAYRVAFEQVYQMSNVRMPFKRVNSSNLMTFECCFLIS